MVRNKVKEREPQAKIAEPIKAENSSVESEDRKLDNANAPCVDENVYEGDLDDIREVFLSLE